RMPGFSVAELRGFTVPDFHPEDRLEYAMEKFEAQLGYPEGTVSQEIPCRRKDGTVHYADIGTSQLTFDGRKSLIGVFRDATERKQAEDALRLSEEWLRTMTESVVDGLITIDDEGIVRSFNPAAERVFGYAADEVIGQNVKMLMPEPHRSEHDGRLSHYKETGEGGVVGKAGREVPGKRKDGSIVPIELGVSEVRVADERLFVGSLRDITERKKLERVLGKIRRRQRKRGSDA
ncbi:hypothetical protein LCGC14_1319570, partial [marine sediment metagenome]